MKRTWASQSHNEVLITTLFHKPSVNLPHDHSARSCTQQLSKLMMSEEKYEIFVWQTTLCLFMQTPRQHIHIQSGLIKYKTQSFCPK